METITQKGFMKKFVNIYFDEMQKMDFTKIQALQFFDKEYKRNKGKGKVNNLFDMIENAKKTTLKP
jgi:hypothetical protein